MQNLGPTTFADILAKIKAAKLQPIAPTLVVSHNGQLGRPEGVQVHVFSSELLGEQRLVVAFQPQNPDASSLYLRTRVGGCQLPGRHAEVHIANNNTAFPAELFSGLKRIWYQLELADLATAEPADASSPLAFSLVNQG